MVHLILRMAATAVSQRVQASGLHNLDEAMHEEELAGCHHAECLPVENLNGNGSPNTLKQVNQKAACSPSGSGEPSPPLRSGKSRALFKINNTSKFASWSTTPWSSVTTQCHGQVPKYHNCNPDPNPNLNCTCNQTCHPNHNCICKPL